MQDAEETVDPSGTPFKRVERDGSSVSQVDGRVVIVGAHKGGVGKTTTALALAAGLARYEGVRVLLVDLDSQGCATRGLIGEELDDDAPSTADLFREKPLSVAACSRDTAVPNLRPMPATLRLEMHARWLLPQIRREELLARALVPARRDYAWVIVDCQPSLAALVETAFAAADAVIIPCRNEARGRDGVVGVVRVLQEVRPGFERWAVLRTQFDRRRRRMNIGAEPQLAEFAARTFATVIPQCEALNEAQVYAEDIFAVDLDCTGAVAYRHLLAEVMTWAAQEPALPRR